MQEQTGHLILRVVARLFDPFFVSLRSTSSNTARKGRPSAATSPPLRVVIRSLQEAAWTRTVPVPVQSGLCAPLIQASRMMPFRQTPSASIRFRREGECSAHPGKTFNASGWRKLPSVGIHSWVRDHESLIED